MDYWFIGSGKTFLSKNLLKSLKKKFKKLNGLMVINLEKNFLKIWDIHLKIEKKILIE